MGNRNKSNHALTKKPLEAPEEFFGQGVSRTGLRVLGVPDRCEKPWLATPRGGLCLEVHGAPSPWLPAPCWSLALKGKNLWKEGGSGQEQGLSYGEGLLSPSVGAAPEARRWFGGRQGGQRELTASLAEGLFQALGWASPGSPPAHLVPPWPHSGSPEALRKWGLNTLD